MRLDLPKDKIERLGRFFTDDFKESVATTVFFKALTLFTVVKMILVWPITRMVILHHNISFPRSMVVRFILAPAYFANIDIDLFFISGLIVLLVVLCTKPNYLSAIFLFWLTLNLYIINLPVSNGSDIVLFMLSLWCIPMASARPLKNGRAEIVQKTVYNLGLFFCRLQVIFIYFVSGADKILSETWRSGTAFDYIRHLEVWYNPMLPDFLATESWNLAFSWLTIFYEIIFGVLVWTKTMRIPILITGGVFHLFIWFVLSLPDFGLLMMISLLIFLKDSDYSRLRKRIMPSLPLM